MATSETVDLTESHEVTTALLLAPLEWRVRAVEHLEIESAVTCLRRRSLQCGPMRPLIQQVADLGDATSALLVLNVVALPRAPLLDLDVKGPGGSPAFLLSRTEIAARETDFLVRLASDAGVSAPPELRSLLEAVVGISDAPWVDLGDRDAARGKLPEFLAQGLNTEIPQHLFDGWLKRADRAAELMAGRLDRPHLLSPVTMPLLAVPDALAASDGGVHEVHGLLHEYVAFLEALAALAGSASPSAADEALNALGDYAANYDMLAAAEVPLDRPFELKYSERRPVSFTPLRNRAKQDLLVADAQTNHVSVRVTDPNVRLHDLKANAAGSNADAYGFFRIRATDQVSTFYAYDPDREYRISVRFRLSPLRRLSFVPYLVSLVLVALSAALVHDKVHALKDLALVAGPAALAASVLLAREPTTLGSRLRLRANLFVAAGLVLLLSVTAGLYLSAPQQHRATKVRHEGSRHG